MQQASRLFSRATATAGDGSAGGGIRRRSNNNNGSNTNTNNNPQQFLTRYFFIVLMLFGCMMVALNSRFSYYTTGTMNNINNNMGMLEQHLKASTSHGRMGEKKKKKKSTQKNKDDETISNNIRHVAIPSSPNVVISKKEPPQSSNNNNQKVKDSKKSTPSFIQNTETKNTNPNSSNEQQQQQQTDSTDGQQPSQQQHQLANLNCEPWGGPSNELAKEMVYWEDIPSDSKFISPYFDATKPTQYMTFEPDNGGWNNIRMAMESLLATAFAMGRTLVLPPHQGMYLLNKKDNQQRNTFSFEHFFHMERISQEHVGFNIISMKEFLELFLEGKFRNKHTGDYLFPPNNRTDWNDCTSQELYQLKMWLREEASRLLEWDPEECMAAFPRSSNSSQELIDIHEEIRREGYPHYEEFVGKPTPVDASPKDRMRENWADRKGLCLYDSELQQAPWVHFPICGRNVSYEIMSDMSMKFNVLPVVSLLPFEDEYKNEIQATIVMVTLIHFMFDGVIFNTNRPGYQSNEFTT
eukprot:scaffold8865_cov67-Cylindrotheca_fusiformis.AAC.1